MGVRTAEGERKITFGEIRLKAVWPHWSMNPIALRAEAPVIVNGQETELSLNLGKTTTPGLEEAEAAPSFGVKNMKKKKKRELARDIGLRVCGGPKKKV